MSDLFPVLMQVQVQVQPQQQQIQESTSQQQSTEQQIVQVCISFTALHVTQSLGPLNVYLCSLLSGADPGSAARSDAGSGSSSALWVTSAATGCDYSTADSAW